MFKFRSEVSRVEKLFVPRAKIWLIILLTLLAGTIFKSFKIINFEPIGFSIIFILIVATFLPVLLLKDDKQKNFYYGLSLAFLDPIFITFLLLFADNYHHVFLFLYVLSLFYSGLIVGRFYSLVITAFNALLFLAVVNLADYNLNRTFIVAVILTFFVSSLSLTSFKDYFKHIIRYLRIKDKNISVLEFFNIYLINNMQNALITIDEEYKISFWNDAASKLFKKEYKEVVNRSLKEIYPSLCTHCGESASEYMETIEEIDGRNVVLTVKVSPIVVEGEFVGNILVIDDITKYKEEQRVNEQNKRLAAIGRLVAALAHELRNPLASISGSVEMLKDYDRGSDEHTRLMRIILREIDGLNVLICELLDFVKPIKLKRIEFNLTDLINDTLDLIKFEKKLRFEPQLKENVMCKGDPNKLKQVFMNILKNAVEVLEEPYGRIRVYLETFDSGKITVVFEDNGPGIDEENFEKIYEPFFTTKDRGTGLGLATCQNILVMHGADISVESKPGLTKFKITL